MENIPQPDLNILDFGSLTSQPYQDACITIGNFDGVHLGHQAIINRMVRRQLSKTGLCWWLPSIPIRLCFLINQEHPYYLSTPGKKSANCWLWVLNRWSPSGLTGNLPR
jgi:FAD synthase